MPLAQPVVGIRIDFGQGPEQRLRIDVEHDAVDRVEHERIVTEVSDLDQREPGERLVRRTLYGLVDLLRGRQRMVSVADREQERIQVLRAEMLVKAFPVRQRGECTGGLFLQVVRKQVAADGAAALHQVEMIDHLHPALLRRERLEDGLFRIVDQHKNVGELQVGASADRDARRQTLRDDSLGRADQAVRVFGVIVLLQIDGAHQARADQSVRKTAFHVDQAVGVTGEQTPVQILVHRAVDRFDALFGVGAVEPDLGQSDAQGRRSVTHELLHTVPVVGLGSELVAGNNAPFAHIAAGGDQDIRRPEAEFRPEIGHSRILRSLKNHSNDNVTMLKYHFKEKGSMPLFLLFRV